MSLGGNEQGYQPSAQKLKVNESLLHLPPPSSSLLHPPLSPQSSSTSSSSGKPLFGGKTVEGPPKLESELNIMEVDRNLLWMEYFMSSKERSRRAQIIASIRAKPKEVGGLQLPTDSTSTPSSLPSSSKELSGVVDSELAFVNERIRPRIGISFTSGIRISSSKTGRRQPI